ncbi:MAG TPA: CTP synthase, partial [Candidatus Limnocylindria bacterium]
FEVNNAYRDRLGEAGMWFSGISPDGRLVEYVELRNHPWFVATQAHPELKSRPNRPHPLFRDFVGAAAALAGLATAPAEIEAGNGVSGQTALAAETEAEPAAAERSS